MEERRACGGGAGGESGVTSLLLPLGYLLSIGSEDEKREESAVVVVVEGKVTESLALAALARAIRDSR